jgi:hypothetical protein
LIDISNLSKPLLQAEGSANWQKHVTPGTLSILQDEKNWEGVGPVKNKVGTTEFEQANGQSWNKLRGKLDIDSEGTWLIQGQLTC